MKISELINTLQHWKDLRGDLEVVIESSQGEYLPVPITDVKDWWELNSMRICIK